VPLLPASLTESLWVEFAALIESDRPEFDPTHPWGCHRRRIPNRVVFDHVIAALVHGSGYERIATPGCSDRTIRRRLDDWADAGVGEQVLRTALAGYDQMIGLDLDDLSVDGSITKSPCGGEVAGRSPVDRGKQGTKRSVACDNQGIPLHLVAARANDHDSPLLEPTLAGIVEMIGPLPQHRGVHGEDLFPTVHLDRGYDSGKTRDLLEILGFTGEIATKILMPLARRSRVAETGGASPADVVSPWRRSSPHQRLTLEPARLGTPGCRLHRARVSDS
jgi:hypothetical protein